MHQAVPPRLPLQAWVSSVADKLEVLLEKLAPGSGFKQQK
jgi:hypothetical protein